MDKHWFYAELLSYSILLEVSGYPKPGNVHRTKNLPGLVFEDFLYTGISSVKWFRKGIIRGLRGYSKIVFGDIIYGIVHDTISYRGVNTCLGSSLLLAPISIGIGRCIGKRIENIKCYIEEALKALKNTTVYDSIYFYRAVRLAKPSYIRKNDDTGEYVNVWDKSFRSKLIARNQRLHDILEYSAGRDIVADEVVNGYPRSIDGKMFFQERFSEHKDWNRGVVETYLYLLSKHKDTTITRTHGENTAYKIMVKARETLKTVLAEKNDWMKPVIELDIYLRKQNINPGSIADIVVSTIAFILLNKNFPYTPKHGK
ncbi:triphosphoribosyl-dephospho-CoA synthase [Staphylothermus hellenicus]|uniref:Triphosphoribosyl-dephospho-CoA protein n=1 Tax=Staphylothermus hellenicus (strain DSM 12710 / JCM 10830 / BK20S6-10-b1 / P8) TaxID=591019 RepID=D7DBJ1_STAHD|nr:triphosphoribosyl-dephospho-CoA synthase [Staphylothermus hellenicus]ADI31538.1 triphosphoribosyl-dephospho-CoA protein [Staphylothermus hellenicus DSM 12710]